MAELHVMKALRDKRSELSGVVSRLEQQLAQHRGSLAQGCSTLLDRPYRGRSATPAMRSEAADRRKDTRAGQCLTFAAASGLEVAVAVFSPLLDLLADVPDPRRAQGQLYKLRYVLLFSILAIVCGCNSYRGIVTFINVHRRRLNASFGLNWRRALAHSDVLDILQRLDPAGVEAAFRRHTALLQAARARPEQGSVALDGKTLRGSFDKFNDRSAAQVLSAFANDTALVLAHVDSAEKSNEIPAAQALLAELGLALGAIVTLDAMHCQKNISKPQQRATSP